MNDSLPFSAGSQNALIKCATLFALVLSSGGGLMLDTARAQPPAQPAAETAVPSTAEPVDDVPLIDRPPFYVIVLNERKSVV